MPRLASALLAFSAITPLLAATPAAPAPATPEPYFSYGKPADAGDLRCRIRTFRHPASGNTVVIMGMIHLADETFYKRAQTEITHADVALMEGVTGSGSIATLPLRYYSGLGQRIMAPSRLGMQQELLPATLPACENADVNMSELSPGFGAAVMGTLALPVVAVVGETVIVIQSAGELTFGCFGYTGEFTAAHRAKLAETLGRPEGESGMDNTLILDHRNAVLLGKLDAHLKTKRGKRILLPWGAAHGVGLEKGLLERGCVPIADEWVPAIGVKSFAANGYKAPGSPRYMHVPFVMSYRDSDSVLAHSGPFWIWDYTDSPAYHSAGLGWILFSDFAIRGGESGTAIGAGLLYRAHREKSKCESTVLLGALRATETDTTAGTEESHHLLGLVGTEKSPAHTRVRVGWWGALFDRVGKSNGDTETSVLPRVLGRPLLYDAKTTAGKTRHRFLLFFTVGD